MADIVMNQPGGMSPSQVRGLARAMKRSPEAIRHMILDARERFIEKAGRYVEIHIAATEDALATGDNEQALKGSQWALSNIGADNTRVVDRPNTESNGVKVMIGVKIGGMQNHDA